MANHIPTENDEWMVREIKRLPQLTRIFPPEPSVNAKGGAAGDKDEDEENGSDDEGDKEEGADGVSAGVVASDGTVATAKPVKSATYEEIMFQVCYVDVLLLICCCFCCCCCYL